MSASAQMPEEDAFSRLRLLIGEEGLANLSRASVFICGVGGVGSWAAEEIGRSGIGRIAIMDPDTVRPSNINRQLCALHSTLGRLKVEVVAERLRDINPAAEIVSMPERLLPEKAAPILEKGGFDCVIDAIDELPSKIALISECTRRGIPLVSSMGAARKMDPSQIRTADIGATNGDPLARAVRQKLRMQGIRQGVSVVFSPEPAMASERTEGDEAVARPPLGTISYMPALFGVRCAAEVIRLLLARRP